MFIIKMFDSQTLYLYISQEMTVAGLEHLKIKTRLIDEMFASVMGEYVFLK